MPAKILNFDTKLPEVIYLDSNVIINFCNKSAKYYNPCKNFIRRTREEGVLVVVSTLTLDEVWYGLLRRITRDLFLVPNIFLIEIRAESVLASLDMMEKYLLFPRDAIHLSSMLSIGVKNIATTDLDFILVDDIKVYTCNPDAFR